MIAKLQRANVDLQQRLEAALARRDSDCNERIEYQAATITKTSVSRSKGAEGLLTKPIAFALLREENRCAA